jgi:hypothetical protein
MATATLDQLANELVTRIKTVNDFTNAGFYVYNLEELEQTSSTAGFPLAGVAYEGSEVADKGKNPARGHTTMVYLRATFHVIVGVNYQYVTDVDTKKTATDLLDSIKQALLGYRGVNTKPWYFAGEFPVDGKTEGVIYYGQLWETDLPMVGTFEQP